MKKTLLTSMLVMCVAAPAVAVPQSGEFPENGLMQEDYTYTGAATYENMGVYSGTVIADPEYENILYQIAAGQYLAHGTTTGTECPAGAFCGGLTDATYNETTDNGITLCSSLGNGSYSNSMAGSTASTDCYRTCETGDVAHATAVTGAMYYNGTDGDGVNACAPAENSCENGYHYSPVVVAPDLSSIGNNAASGFGYISNDGEGTYNESTYGLSQNGTFVVDYGNGKKISGKSQCSTQSGTNNDYTWADPTISASLPDSTGQYCYCQLDGYTLNGGAMQSLSAPWVFFGDDGDAGTCAYYCAHDCASVLQGADTSSLAFRAAVFGSVQSTPASCEANTIDITWNGTTADAISINNAGQCTYGGDIRTPQSAVVPNGKRFVGWRFRNEND